MSYQNIDMTFIFLSPFAFQGGKLFFQPCKTFPSREFTKIMLLAYSIKGFSLLTKSKRVGNFLSKWERIRLFLKSFPPIKSLQPQGIWCSRWESGKLFFKIIFESQ